MLDGDMLYGGALFGGVNNGGNLWSFHLPEPSSALLLLFGAAGLIRRRPRGALN